MSKYTTQLRWPVEQRLSDLGLSNSESNWPQVYEFIGLSDYPIFDEGHRQVLNDKIIRAYYFREIGFETFGQFVFMLRRTMFEIMPYYNQLYESEGIVTDPLLTRNMSFAEKWTRDEADSSASETSAASESSSSENDRNVFQDTPMNGLDTGAIESMSYASAVTFDDSSASASSTRDSSSTSNRTGDYEGTREHLEKGLDSSQSDELRKYRDTFLNIDLMVVNDLGTLFMGLW